MMKFSERGQRQVQQEPVMMMEVTYQTEIYRPIFLANISRKKSMLSLIGHAFL